MVRRYDINKKNSNRWPVLKNIPKTLSHEHRINNALLFTDDQD